MLSTKARLRASRHTTYLTRKMLPSSSMFMAPFRLATGPPTNDPRSKQIVANVFAYYNNKNKYFILNKRFCSINTNPGEATHLQ